METKRLTFAEARELASCGLVFTGHTPVMAGHDYFPADLMDRYFAELRARGWGSSRSEFLGLGRKNPADEVGEFLHDRAGAAHGGLPATASASCTARCQPRDVAGALARRPARTKFPSAT